MKSETFGNNYNFQTNILAILEEIDNDSIIDASQYLQSIVQQIIKHEDFKILGGRIWQLIPDKKVYRLISQTGNLKRIPDGYQVDIYSEKKFQLLPEAHTLVGKEEDLILLDSGILIYSIAGAGDFIKIEGNRYYSFILGFNAPEISDEFRVSLNLISNFTSMKLHELQQDKYKKKYEKDLSNASQLQRRLLPEHHLEFHDYELYGACIQHGGDSNVGGDYFDYFLNNTHEEDRLGVLISDAASKGLPAAVQSAFVSGAIKMAQSFSPKISTLLSSINRLVFDTFPFERPVSMCYCELTLSSNRLVLYANAGHVPQIHFRPSTGEFQYLYPTGGLLGILKDQRYVVENVRMLPGDVLCLFSDGITEATDDNGKQFEKERLKSILKENCAGNPETIAHKVIEAVEVFASSEQYNDDRTIIVIKRHENDK